MSDTGAGPVSVVMVAIGGYGSCYLETLLSDLPPSRCRLAGVVDPMAAKSRLWPVVGGLNVPIRSSIEEFYAEGHRADLAIISSPIHWHVPQSIIALSCGSSVLCDKPLGATIQEAEDLIRARRRSGRWVMIGYQWSFSSAILALKRDVLAGLFGRPARCSALCCWPRDLGYYGRNDWAGRLRDGTKGRWILDGPANNAMAHYLHNLFFLLGPKMHLSARPGSVRAELYHAYPIESCDTTICRVMTEGGVEVLFYASHATEHTLAPRFRLEFEDAVITCGEEEGSDVVAIDRNGRRRRYGSPDDTPQFHKLGVAIDRVSRGIARTELACNDEPVVCGPEAAMSQTLCVNGMHDSVSDVARFPSSFVRREGAPERLFVPGLDELLLRCYEKRILPSEADDGRAPWVVAGPTVDLAGYHYFPGGGRGPQQGNTVEVRRS
jgi:predicted dehydrogenase